MTAKIYKPAKNAMQSGKGKQSWVLEYMPDNTRSIDPVIGWNSNTDTTQQIHLKFQKLEDAEKYAQHHKINYIVTLPKSTKLIKQTYADNFLGNKGSY